MIIPSLNVSFNTILSTDIYVALEQELCLPSRSEYIRLFWTCRASTISDLPINLRLSHKRVSPLMTTHSSGKLVDARKYLTKLEI